MKPAERLYKDGRSRGQETRSARPCKQQTRARCSAAGTGEKAPLNLEGLPRGTVPAAPSTDALPAEPTDQTG